MAAYHTSVIFQIFNRSTLASFNNTVHTCAIGQDTHYALLRICRHGSQSLIPWQVSGIIIDTFKDLKARE